MKDINEILNVTFVDFLTSVTKRNLVILFFILNNKESLNL
jgi:hypothetical protein